MLFLEDSFDALVVNGFNHAKQKAALLETICQVCMVRKLLTADDAD
jgi:hypothetical protein